MCEPIWCANYDCNASFCPRCDGRCILARDDEKEEGECTRCTIDPDKRTFTDDEMLERLLKDAGVDRTELTARMRGILRAAQKVESESTRAKRQKTERDDEPVPAPSESALNSKEQSIGRK